MSKLTHEMKEAINKSVLLPLATASNMGIPNVIPIKFVFVENDDELWLVDNFFMKTLQNLKQNPLVALYVYLQEDSICFQVKGTVDIQTSGTAYNRMKEMVCQERPDLPAKSLIVMHITDIYQCLPGNNAGDRIN